MDTHTAWNDIYDGSLLWKEIQLNTDVAARPLAGRKQGNVSGLRVLTFDVPWAWKTVPGWPGPRSLPGCCVLPFRAGCWCHLLRTLPWPHYLQWPRHFPFILFVFITITHPSFLDCLLVVFMDCLSSPSPPQTCLSVRCYWAMLSNRITSSHTWLLTIWHRASPN